MFTASVTDGPEGQLFVLQLTEKPLGIEVVVVAKVDVEEQLARTAVFVPSA